VAIDLKQEREKKKISLAQVASDTRISMRYLEYIEEGRYGDLPGGVYNRAFIKAYCESINLDPREILEHYDRQVSSSIPERNQRTEVLPPSQSTFFIPIPILIWSIMLLISAIGLFFSRAWIADLFAPYFADKPATEAQYSAPPESRTKPGSPASVAPPATASESADTDDIATNNAGTSLKADRTAPNGPATDVAEPLGSESVDTKLRMEIVAKDSCWISVDVDGRPTSRRLMEPGEKRVFNARERLFILIGNAGGVQLKINGKPTRPLGDPGEVIKMNIDLENLQQFLDKSAG
jgi:cytoskeleton protein RodZ